MTHKFSSFGNNKKYEPEKVVFRLEEVESGNAIINRDARLCNLALLDNSQLLEQNEGNSEILNRSFFLIFFFFAEIQPLLFHPKRSANRVAGC